jgi:hypothetical protein
MNLLFVLAMITATDVTPLAQFKTREACMFEATRMKEQNVQAVCLPKSVQTPPTEKEVTAEINRAMGVMRALIAAMPE